MRGPKTVKLASGARISIKAIRLPNGNLLIPVRHDSDRTIAVWKEVAPGSSEYKRWLSVAVDEPDPRAAHA